ncbi:hypothetical protein E1218_01190 [Kribbella turkmenica]|uniref:Uncharacterized protein n=1 Tax=Kribbella turkmenica TaxID=2530375 RepID=A0A4V2YHC3_9ACTN|nr:hypothetical protein [Kribbella turkmenica]TDD30447.1 hypothetical protein E1218_01190 [Kribbella turkmenica]
MKYEPARRDGDSIWSNFPSWSDAESEHSSRHGFRLLAGTELLADGLSLGEYGAAGKVLGCAGCGDDLICCNGQMGRLRGDYKWKSPTTPEIQELSSRRGQADTVDVPGLRSVGRPTRPGTLRAVFPISITTESANATDRVVSPWRKLGLSRQRRDADADPLLNLGSEVAARPTAPKPPTSSPSRSP